EEAKYADIILHVVDSANPDVYNQMHIVYETLETLGVKDKIIITAFNKQDKLDVDMIIKDFKADKTVKISAKTGDGLESLLRELETVLQERKVYIEQIFPYAEAGKLQLIRKYGQLLEESYREDGIFVKAYVPREIYLGL
ncbi:MAG: GTPase HflX, partial [Acetivibrio sp.]